MNNDQFRKLLLANAAKSAKDGTSSTPKGPGATPSSTLGSRMKSSIPMTPRSVAGGGRNNEFARQLAERDTAGQPKKKYRTSAPKGSRFAEGYVDRAKERQVAADAAEDDDKAARIKALEESLKKEEIDQATFEKLSSEIAGGDLASTHLIKGLDFKLLERIRKGEDVFGEEAAAPDAKEEDGEGEPGEDVDDAFEELEDKEVEAVVKEKAKKKGQLATTTLVPGQKRSRDQILAEMKAAREAAKANQLGSRFKKIGAKKEPGSRVERDAKGREVLIIVDEDGNERRKVRKVAAEVEREREAFKVAPDAEVLGMEVPEYYQKKLEEQQKEEEEDVKMFSDVESDYDPLQGLGSESDDDESGDEAKKQARSKSPDSRSSRSEGEVGSESPPSAAKRTMAPPPKPQQATQNPRNYFKSGGLISEQKATAPALTDPSVLAALKKAKTLNAQTKSEEEQKEAEREAKLKKMLASADRDDADMDMGFGESRQQDEEEMEDDGKTKLSAWGGAGADDDDDDDGRGGGKAKRKRGGKKRKGDGNNVADVMRVIEKRKETGA